MVMVHDVEHLDHRWWSEGLLVAGQVRRRCLEVLLKQLVVMICEVILDSLVNRSGSLRGSQIACTLVRLLAFSIAAKLVRGSGLLYLQWLVASSNL